MNIWIDIKMPHEPLFFKSIIEHFNEFKYQVTTRDFAEIQSLLEKYKMSFTLIGKRVTGSFLIRKFHFLIKVMRLFVTLEKYDFSLSHSSPWGVYTALLNGKKSIVFYDNETNPINKNVFRFTSFLFTPNAIPLEKLKRLSGKDTQIIQFNGFKEDIYIADYKPDYNFLSKLPFEDFVTIRPENLDVLYLKDSQRKTIVPDLIRDFSNQGVKVLYLPRTEFERSLAEGYDNVFMPEKALNGLDICFYSKAVISGSGTISREASRMGTTAVSFFPGKLLAVDKKLINKNKLYHSRNSLDIVNYVLENKKQEFNIDDSIKVKKEVFSKLRNIIENI